MKFAFLIDHGRERPLRMRRGGRRIILAALTAVLLAPTSFYAWRSCVAHNFGVLEPGRVYRSGQLPAAALSATVRDRKIKTVLNLRGSNPDQAWYRAERRAASTGGATLVDVAMSSCQWMSREQLRAVVRVLDTSEYPLLIHCQQGAERTGWVSAVATLLQPGTTLDDAERQFSLGYLFVRIGDGKVMAEHLDRYEAWLADHGWGHSPERFRRWVNEGFKPGHPSREDWPYDPYPLVVVTRPGENPVETLGVVGASAGVGGMKR